MSLETTGAGSAYFGRYGRKALDSWWGRQRRATLGAPATCAPAELDRGAVPNFYVVCEAGGYLMCRATMTIGAPSGAGGARQYRSGPPPPVRYPPSSMPAFLVNFRESRKAAISEKTNIQTTQAR